MAIDLGKQPLQTPFLVVVVEVVVAVPPTAPAALPNPGQIRLFWPRHQKEWAAPPAHQHLGQEGPFWLCSLGLAPPDGQGPEIRSRPWCEAGTYHGNKRNADPLPLAFQSSLAAHVSLLMIGRLFAKASRRIMRCNVLLSLCWLVLATTLSEWGAHLCVRFSLLSSSRCAQGFDGAIREMV